MAGRGGANGAGSADPPPVKGVFPRATPVRVWRLPAPVRRAVQGHVGKQAPCRFGRFFRVEGMEATMSLIDCPGPCIYIMMHEFSVS